MQSWSRQISLVRYIFTQETACTPGAARSHLPGTYLHGVLHEVLGQPDLTYQVHERLHAVLGQPDLTCQVHIYTGDCMLSWGSQISVVKYILSRETACSTGAARSHLSGTYLHWRLHGVLGQPHLTCQVHIYTGDCMLSWGSHTSLVRYIFTRETACSPAAARSHLSGTYLHGRLHAVLGQPHFTCQVHIYTETACSPGTATLHLSGTYLHRILHAVLGQPHFTCQVHIDTGDCMQTWGSQISLVRYMFTRETACSPGVGRSHLSGTYLHRRLHAVLGQPDLTCQVHIYTRDCMQSWGSQTSLVR
jgi:hypothetical protein